MKREMIINTAKDMIDLGYQIGVLAKPNMVIALEGDLGAGKTTLTKGIAQGLGIRDIVNSPTFTIMKIYQGKMTLFHLDVYRIDEDDFELQEYFEQNGLCVIEWAKRIKEILPNAMLSITLTTLNDDVRHVVLESNDPVYHQMVKEVHI